MDVADARRTEERALKQAMGRAIARTRVEAGFATQAAFSRAIEVRFQYMSRVERGDENLSLETLAKMTRALGVSMPDFLARVAQEMLDPSAEPAPRRGRPSNM